MHSLAEAVPVVGSSVEKWRQVSCFAVGATKLYFSEKELGLQFGFWNDAREQTQGCKHTQVEARMQKMVTKLLVIQRGNIFTVNSKNQNGLKITQLFFSLRCSYLSAVSKKGSFSGTSTESSSGSLDYHQLAC